jgi:hypothetical protein
VYWKSTSNDFVANFLPNDIKINFTDVPIKPTTSDAATKDFSNHITTQGGWDWQQDKLYNIFNKEELDFSKYIT